MAPVIRVSDSVFVRLQSLAQPFVDTPNAVIERLLDLQSHNHGQRTPNESRDISTREAQDARPDFNLFLAPAAADNARVTIETSVSVADALEIMSPAQRRRFGSIVEDRESFRCWAMTSGKRSVFRQMTHGDVVLLSLNGSGNFDYSATIVGTIESAELGASLWPAAGELPWSLIYVVDAVRRVHVRKEVLNTRLGYDPHYRLPGVIRVRDELLRRALARFGDLDGLVRDD